eukprot:TRINITY_DN13634_c0_g1_i1.p1 TRINITY_DN13634_c0_g1~~TRINITY_DN13634_c0_g1_i1.p1  ORF type:complete len:740 (+),score=105.30 TRINITY_DN13634_c0_g1_i1:124-2220(+)
MVAGDSSGSGLQPPQPAHRLNGSSRGLTSGSNTSEQTCASVRRSTSPAFVLRPQPGSRRLECVVEGDAENGFAKAPRSGRTTFFQDPRLEHRKGPQPTTIRSTLFQSVKANVAFILATLLHCAMLGVVTELSFRNTFDVGKGGVAFRLLIAIDSVLSIFFLVEYTHWAKVVGCQYVSSVDGFVDFALVVMSCLDVGFRLVFDADVAGAVSALRLLRLLWLLRTVRLRRLFPETQVIFPPIGKVVANGALGLCTLALAAYMGSVICMTYVGVLNLDSDNDVHTFFGSVPMSFLTNIRLTLLGGRRVDVAAVMLRAFGLWTYCILAFAFIFGISVRMVVMGMIWRTVHVWSESTSPPSKEDVDLRIETFRNRVHVLFDVADKDDDGVLSKREFARVLRDRDLRQFLKEFRVVLPKTQVGLLAVFDGLCEGRLLFEDWYSGIKRLRGTRDNRLLAAFQLDALVKKEKVVAHIGACQEEVNWFMCELVKQVGWRFLSHFKAATLACDRLRESLEEVARRPMVHPAKRRQRSERRRRHESDLPQASHVAHGRACFLAAAAHMQKLEMRDREKELRAGRALLIACSAATIRAGFVSGIRLHEHACERSLSACPIFERSRMLASLFAVATHDEGHVGAVFDGDDVEPECSITEQPLWSLTRVACQELHGLIPAMRTRVAGARAASSTASSRSSSSMRGPSLSIEE